MSYRCCHMRGRVANCRKIFLEYGTIQSCEGAEAQLSKQSQAMPPHTVVNLSRWGWWGLLIELEASTHKGRRQRRKKEREWKGRKKGRRREEIYYIGSVHPKETKTGTNLGCFFYSLIPHLSIHLTKHKKSLKGRHLSRSLELFLTCL